MKTSAETGQVWARNVADALTKKLNSFDCPFYWAKAGEDILKKEPTCLWPKDPQYLYQVEEGTNEGLYVEVLHRDANGKSVQLLVVKFLTSIKAAGACRGYVSEFLESFDPEQLRTA